jgi:hypothetical protein
MDVERGGLFAVEGAEAAEARAHALERDVVPDERNDVGAIPDLVDLFLGDLHVVVSGREPEGRPICGKDGR